MKHFISLINNWLSQKCHLKPAANVVGGGAASTLMTDRHARHLAIGVIILVSDDHYGKPILFPIQVSPRTRCGYW